MDQIAKLATVIDRHVEGTGICTTAMPHLSLIRADAPSTPTPAVYEASLCLIAQGSKRVSIGHHSVVYDAAHYLLVSVDLPLVGHVIDASPGRPYLCCKIDLDPAMLADLMVTEGGAVPRTDLPLLGVYPSDPDLIDAASRLVGLLDRPETIRTLSPLIEREILYRLLTGPHGPMLRHVATAGRWLSVEPVRPFLGGWQRNILIALAVSLLLLAPIAWIFARRLTRPFRALAGALDNDRAAPLPHEGPRELREAAAAIAAMRDRLAIEAAERARMLTAIAHDLRTPLTGLRLRIEAAPEPQRARMVADVERMQAMIGEVLAFARDAAAPAEVVDVRPLLTAIIEDMGQGSAIVRLLPGDEARVSVPERIFRRAVENLLRNAIDYAGGGRLTVRQADTKVCISVADDGPGIPAGDRERLLRPFERGDASRNRDTGGAGLGLSIVCDFAAEYGGDFTLADAPNGGTIATLRLPSA